MSNRPIMIAVGGDSGSGKATLCRGFATIFGAGRTEIISLDDYHSLDRRQRKAVDISAADPRATNFAAIEEDLWALREGRTIAAPTYDHATGTFGATHPVSPKDIVVVYGLFPLFTRALRSLFDVTVWLAPDDALRARWKTSLDTLERGYPAADVRDEIVRRAPDAEKYVAPQAKFADLTVTFHPARRRDGAADTAPLSARIRKGGRFRPLDYAEFESSSTSIRQTTTLAGGYPETIIDIDGDIESHAAEALEERLWTVIAGSGRSKPTGLGTTNDGDGNASVEHALALTQLLIARRVVLIEHELLEAVT